MVSGWRTLRTSRLRLFPFFLLPLLLAQGAFADSAVSTQEMERGVLHEQSIPTPSHVVVRPLGSLDASWIKNQEKFSQVGGVPVLGAIVSSDGQSIAFLTSRAAYVLDRSGNLRTSIAPWPTQSPADRRIFQFEFTRDGQRLLVAGADKLGYSETCSSLGQRYDGVYTVQGSEIWANKSSIGANLCGPLARVTPDGKWAATILPDGSGIIWRDGNFRARAQTPGSVTNTFIYNNETYQGKVYTRRIGSATTSAKLFDLNPDGKTAALAYATQTYVQNNTIEIVTDSGGVSAKDNQALFSIDDLRYTPDNKLVVRSGPDVILLNPTPLPSYGNLPVFWTKRAEGILAWDVAEDSFAAGTSNKEIVWVRSGHDVLNKKAEDKIDKIDLSADGKFLVAASSNNFKIRLFSDTGQQIWEASATSPVAAVSVANDGTVFAAAGSNTYFFPTSTLDVDSLPSGASVTVDGSDYGTTPVRALGLKPGNHEVTVKLAGHNDCAGTVPVDGLTQRFCSLVPLSGASQPSSSATPVSTVASSPSPAASPVPTLAPSVTPTPAPSPPVAAPSKSPGFETLLGLAALGVAVTLRKRRA